jgi:hypothetical protein
MNSARIAFTRLPILLSACALGTMTLSPALAAPTPAPIGPLRAFTGHAHADLKIIAGGSPVDLAAHVMIAQRDGLSRFDITIDRGQIPLLPIGAITLVVDRSANTLTFWNAATKMYYTQPAAAMLPSAATPAPITSLTPAPSGKATPAPRSPLADLDVFTLGAQLNGHSTIAGFATTGVVASIDYRKKGATATAHVHATVDLADDYAWFPVDINATIDPAIPGITGMLDYAIDDVVRVEPPASTFVVPAGYQQAATIFGVLSKGSSALPFH